LREAKQEPPSARRSHAPEIGLAQDFCAVRIGDDEAGLRRRHLDRRRIGNGEIEPVAASGVGAPFAVGPEIGRRGFDLDDQDLALAAGPTEALFAGQLRECRPRASAVTLVPHLEAHGVVANIYDWTNTGDLTAIKALFRQPRLPRPDLIVARRLRPFAALRGPVRRGEPRPIRQQLLPALMSD
jgi:hypothetical protein